MVPSPLVSLRRCLMPVRAEQRQIDEPFPTLRAASAPLRPRAMGPAVLELLYAHVSSFNLERHEHARLDEVKRVDFLPRDDEKGETNLSYSLASLSLRSVSHSLCLSR